jgi:hypothetical protein
MHGKSGALIKKNSFLLQVSSSYEKVFIAKWLSGNELALLFLIQGRTLACKLGSLVIDEGWECKVFSMFLGLLFMDASMGREGTNPQNWNFQARFCFSKLLKVHHNFNFFLIFFYVSIFFSMLIHRSMST